MPEPIIYHIDVNSAFLSWQSCYNLELNPNALDLRLIPSAVGGDQSTRHGIVLAKSPSAKKYGIRTGEPLVSAYKKCPELTVVPPNFPVYIEKSQQFMSLLHDCSPIVEQYSIDEAFCDMTGMERLHGDPVTYAHTLGKRIRDELGFTVNIGVSRNKLLAKMASDFTKPDRVHTLFPEEIQDKLWPLTVDELFYVGRSTAQKLHRLGIHTIGELAKTDRSILISHFKKHGDVIWNYANGIAPTSLEEMPSPNKGYGNSMTTHFDVVDANTAKRFLLTLCETVGARIRADHVFITVVTVSMVDHEFHHRSRQTTLPSSTNVTEEIYETVCKLFDEAWSGKPLRQLGVSTSHPSEQQYEQYNLFDMERFDRLSKLNSAIDQIRSRFGEDSIQRACFIDSEEKHMTGGLHKAKREQKNERI